MKVKSTKLSDKEKIITLDTLYTAMSLLKGRQAVKDFLKDLLTPSERIMLGRRIIIARLLIAGEPYHKIIKRLGVGPDTIHRVRRWLDDQMPGYEKVIAQMEDELQERRFKPSLKGSIQKLKRKYPLHFLLFPNIK